MVESGRAHLGAPHIGPWPLRVDRVLYTTIALMAALMIYDGWEQLSLQGMVSVIVGPVVAIFLSHVFAAALAHRVTAGRPLSHRERRVVLIKECRFLFIVVPPVTLVLALAAAGLSYSRCIQVTLFAALLSLGFWGGLAGRRCGLTGWAFAGSVMYGLLLGAIVLVLQVILQPGGHPFLP